MSVVHAGGCLNVICTRRHGHEESVMGWLQGNRSGQGRWIMCFWTFCEGHGFRKYWLVPLPPAGKILMRVQVNIDLYVMFLSCFIKVMSPRRAWCNVDICFQKDQSKEDLIHTLDVTSYRGAVHDMEFCQSFAKLSFKQAAALESLNEKLATKHLLKSWLHPKEKVQDW